MLQVKSYKPSFLVNRTNTLSSGSTRTDFYEEMMSYTQTHFYQNVQNNEQWLFLDSIRRDGFYSNGTGKVRWSTFKPTDHITEGLLTEKLLERLKQERDLRVLSMGAGPAYLERFFVQEGVDQSQITLNDISHENLPDDFEQAIFDFTQDWPQFEQGFDLIIFPQSFSQAINWAHSVGKTTDKAALANKIIRSALEALNPGGEIRIPSIFGWEDKDFQETRRKLERDYQIKIDYNGVRDRTLIIKKK